MREGWTYKKLGDCLSYIKNGANIKQVKGASGIPITRIETLSGGVFNRDRLGYADIFSSDKYCQNIMDDSDILMSHINSKQYIGRSVLYRKEGNEIIIHGMNLLRLKSIPSIVSPYFLNQFFQSDRFRDCVARIRKDAVNQSSMAISDLIKIPVPVPPLAEQERIVAELDLLSSIIDKKKAQLKEYDQLAQSIFYDMFGDPVTNEKGWEVKNLEKICENYDFMRKPITAKDRSQGQIPYYGASGIVDYVKDYIFDGEYLLISEDGANLLARSTPIAFSIKGKTWVNNHAHVLKFSNRTVQQYVEFTINLRDISSIVTGCAQPKLTQANLNKIPIAFPPLTLQQQFVDRIEAIEKQKALVQASIAETETLFNSRMDYYFN